MTGRPVPGVDSATVRKLRRGQIPIDLRLDLHGLFRDAAHIQVQRAIKESVETGMRCLLIITGKGLVLRDALPQWLDDPDLKQHILTTCEAIPEHGGSGAIYVLLRRRRQ